MNEPVRETIAHLIFGQQPPKQQLYGVEIEVEQAQQVWQAAINGEVPSPWAVKEDGSLRNRGAEMLFRHPVTYATAVKAMAWPYSMTWYSGKRAGMHVHADMRRHTLPRVGSIMALYALLEPSLFKWLGDDREQNTYCVPLYRAPQELYGYQCMVNAALAGEPLPLHHLRASCKYSALYGGPLRTFGSLEFRQAPTFDSEELAQAWLAVVRGIVELGASFAHPGEVIAEDPRSLCERALGDAGLYDARLSERFDALGVASSLTRVSSAFNPEMFSRPKEHAGSVSVFRRAPAVILDIAEELAH